MYFEENKINNILNCEKCQKKLVKPVMLPCGFTVCSSCVSDDDRKFTCDLCSDEHSKPKNGFPINKSITKLLLVKSEKISKYEVIEAFKASINEIEENIISLRTGVENGIDYIKEYGLKLKMDAQLAAEEMILEINNNQKN